jgi:hypothetical protein
VEIGEAGGEGRLRIDEGALGRDEFGEGIFPGDEAGAEGVGALAGEREEAYVLRFEDGALADRVRAVLRGEATARPADAAMELDFDGGSELA